LGDRAARARNSCRRFGKAGCTPIYLHLIRRYLAPLGPQPLRILDAGCGTGRILVPLAREGHRLTGIDHHHDSLRVARRNLDDAGLNAELIEGTLEELLAAFPDPCFDAALAIESLYVSRTASESLAQIARILHPQGTAIVTHRTHYYYLLQSLAARRFDDALIVATRDEGRLRKGYHRIFYHWESRAQIDRLYAHCGLDIIDTHPVGPYSGFPPDALHVICDPATLSAGDRERLRELELHHVDRETAMACGYLVVCARKP
jgi:ubiquinone/menaquinone biosynthesis C-methylase UbiE